MKNVKRIVATLLVLTLVLALTGGGAMASCKFKVYDFVKFVKNSNCYEDHKTSTKWDDPETIIRKGSVAQVMGTKGGWVALQITYAFPDDSKYGNTYFVASDGVKWYYWACWVKEDVLKATKKQEISVTFSNGGVGMSKQYPYSEVMDDTGSNADRTDTYSIVKSIRDGKTRLSPDCYKHVKAKAKVWMHKTPSLSNSYGQALHKGDKVTYRRKWALDSRVTIFYGIRYKGKCLWVSEKYTKLVK